MSSIKITPFEVIDNSQIVACISSTAGSEALIRGIPVITFGPAPYRGHKACYDMSDGGKQNDFGLGIYT